jgi:hypothetical protein
VILGRIERQGSTGHSTARNAQGLVVATFDRRGLVAARGNLLAAYLFRP